MRDCLMLYFEAIDLHKGYKGCKKGLQKLYGLQNFALKNIT